MSDTPQSICAWCNTDAEAANRRHEGPHATWCPHFREDQRGGTPDAGKPPEQIALEREIAELAAQGREQERAEAADRLAALIMRRTLP